jgi:hypothetical protein
MTNPIAQARFWLAAIVVAAGLAVARAAETNAPDAKPAVAIATNASAAKPDAGDTADREPASSSEGATNAPVASTNSPAASTNAPAVVDAASSTNAPAAEGGKKKVDFGDFRIVGDRNIFNPNRSPRRTSGRGGRGGPAPVRVETFSLVGTMSYDQGDMAFFDSSSSAYRKSVRTNDTIAAYRVAAVTPTNVKLELDGKTIVALVGTRFRRNDDGPWEFTLPGGTPPAEPKPETASADGATDTEPASDDAVDKGTSVGGSGGAVSDVLKRLMQKREQELKNEKQ